VGLAEAVRRRPGGALTFGFALATFGGPLALTALYAPGVAGPAVPSVGLATLLGGAAFALPVYVWWRYSERVASAGGLVAFVREAAGTRLAVVTGAVWALSYFLYLPYTVAELANETLPIVFPGLHGWRWALQLLLPLAATAFVLAPLAAVFAVFGALALYQLAMLLALGSVELAHVGAPASSFAVHGHADDFLIATFGISLLFVCGSLPFFFGEEVRGGGRTLRRAVAAGFVVAAAYTVFAAFPLAAVPRTLLGGAIPGFDIATAYAGRGFGVAVGVGAILSDALLVLAEFLALSRLLHWATGRSVRTTTLWVAVPFFVADAIALIDPEQFYEKAIKPSLVALWTSQLLVFAAFPLLRRRRLDLFVAAACAALAGWALYRVVGGHGAS
jgi:amino acid transporter